MIMIPHVVYTLLEPDYSAQNSLFLPFRQTGFSLKNDFFRSKPENEPKNYYWFASEFPIKLCYYKKCHVLQVVESTIFLYI